MSSMLAAKVQLTKLFQAVSQAAPKDSRSHMPWDRVCADAMPASYPLCLHAGNNYEGQVGTAAMRHGQTDASRPFSPALLFVVVVMASGSAHRSPCLSDTAKATSNVRSFAMLIILKGWVCPC